MKILIQYITVFFAAFLFSSSALAQQESLLYKIEGKDLKTSYLFGTFHMLPKDDLEIKQKVSKSLSKSEVLVLEIDMSDPNLQSEMMAVSMIPGDDGLQNHMSEEDYNTLDQYFTSKMGVGMAQLNKLKPFVLSSMTMVAHLGQDIASYEMTLMEMAGKNSIGIKGLESASSQMKIFDDQPYEDQIKALMAMINAEGGMEGYFKEMITLYKTEDIDKLHDEMQTYMSEDQEMLTKLLDNRNRNWIPVMEQYSKDQKAFYAVGAAHLGGPNGVVNLLRKAGYTVTPILD